MRKVWWNKTIFASHISTSNNKVRIPLLFYVGGQQHREVGNTDEICPSSSLLCSQVVKQCSQLALDHTQGHVCRGTVGTFAVDCEIESPARPSTYHHTHTHVCSAITLSSHAKHTMNITYRWFTAQRCYVHSTFWRNWDFDTGW